MHNVALHGDKNFLIGMNNNKSQFTEAAPLHRLTKT